MWIEKSVALRGLETLRENVKKYFDDIVSHKVQFPFGVRTCAFELSDEDKDHVRIFVDEYCRGCIDQEITYVSNECKREKDEKVWTRNFAHGALYYGVTEEEVKKFLLSKEILKDICVDISSYVAECYYKIIELEKVMLSGEEKNKLSPYEEYTKTLLDIYNQCRKRREKIDFILTLVKKGLTRGSKGVDYLDWDGRLVLYAGKLEWVKEGERPWQSMSRVITEGVTEFFQVHHPVVFFPYTRKLMSYLKGYVTAKMPLKVPPELTSQPRNWQNEEEMQWWQEVRTWVDCETSKIIDRICSRYKAHVPILCRAKFPEWAVKWVYDLTVTGDES